MEDKELMEMICLGDEEALEYLYIAYWKRMLRVSFEVTEYEEDAEECCNETLYIVWQNIPKTKPTHLWLYIKKILLRVSKDKRNYNRAQKRSEFNKVYYDEEWTKSSRGSVGNNVDRIAFNNAFDDFMSTLSEEKYRVFVARYGMGFLVEEIAKREQVSVSKVKMMLLRMKKELEKYLREENIFF